MMSSSNIELCQIKKKVITGYLLLEGSQCPTPGNTMRDKPWTFYTKDVIRKKKKFRTESELE